MFVRFLMVSAVVTLGFECDPPSGCQSAQWARQGQAWCNARLVQAESWWYRTEVRIVDQISTWPDQFENWVRSMEKQLSEQDKVVADLPEATPTPLPLAAEPTESVNPDLLFTQILERSVADFVADLAPASAEPTLLAGDEPTLAAEPVPPAPEPEPAPVVLAETLDPEALPADLYPGLAFTLNRASEGLARPTCLELDLTPLAVAQETPSEPVTLTEVAPAEATLVDLLADEQASPEITLALPANVFVSEPIVAADPTPATPSAPRRLSQAVELTGKAIQAWASLLRAPTVAFNETGSSLSR